MVQELSGSYLLRCGSHFKRDNEGSHESLMHRLITDVETKAPVDCKCFVAGNQQSGKTQNLTKA